MLVGIPWLSHRSWSIREKKKQQRHKDRKALINCSKRLILKCLPIRIRCKIEFLSVLLIVSRGQHGTVGLRQQQELQMTGQLSRHFTPDCTSLSQYQTCRTVSIYSMKTSKNVVVLWFRCELRMCLRIKTRWNRKTLNFFLKSKLVTSWSYVLIRTSNRKY